MFRKVKDKFKNDSTCIRHDFLLVFNLLSNVNNVKYENMLDKIMPKKVVNMDKRYNNIFVILLVPI